MTDRVKGGMESMCEVMRHYEDIARAAGRAEGRAKYSGLPVSQVLQLMKN